MPELPRPIRFLDTHSTFPFHPLHPLHLFLRSIRPFHSTGAPRTMKKNLLAAAIVACTALPALAQQITVVNFGGANANAQKVAFYEPFEKTGTKVIPVEYNGEQAKIKAMVETKK
ncbi:MAG: hypothetical protein ABI156_04700, partial [Caldimonas sp.]